MEKLRKVLEKKAADFQRENQKTVEVVNKFYLVFCGVSRGVSKMAGPFAGSMEDTNQLYNIAAHAIRNNVWRARDDQLASAGDPAGPAESREMFQSFDRSYDCGHGPGSSFGTVLRDVLGHGNQVRACRSQPVNAHVASSA